MGGWFADVIVGYFITLFRIVSRIVRARRSEGCYRVGLNIAEGMGFSWTSVSFGNHTYRFDFPLAQPQTNDSINLMITREYPRANLDAFSRNTRIKRPQ